MSTAATCTLCSATCLNVDVIQPLTKAHSHASILKYTRFAIGEVALLALSFSILYPQIIGLLLMGYSFGAGELIIPIFAAMFWKRANTPGCIAAMLGGGLSYVILSKAVAWSPLFASIPISFILLVVVSLMTKPLNPSSYAIYFDDEWEKPKNKAIIQLSALQGVFL